MKRSLLLCILLAGCVDDPPSPPIVECAPPNPPPAPIAALPTCVPLTPIETDGFVRRDDTRLLLGGRLFRAVGANVYYVPSFFAYAEEGSARFATAALEALDGLVCMSLRVARMIAFNNRDNDSAAFHPRPGVFRERALRGLDRAVAEAKARGIRVILTLTNNHKDFGGLPEFARWEGRDKDAFFAPDGAAVRQHWKNYAAFITARVNTVTGIAYKDEPAILGWELGNEFRCPSCRGTRQLNQIVRELAAYLRPLVPNQLISDGGEGFDDVPANYASLATPYVGSGDEGASFSDLVEVPEIDLPSYHLYSRNWAINPETDVDHWIDAHDVHSQRANKVAYMGEFAWCPAVAGEAKDAPRAAYYQRWLARYFEDAGGYLALVWQIIPSSRRAFGDDGYGVIFPGDDATIAVLRTWAERLRGF